MSVIPGVLAESVFKGHRQFIRQYTERIDVEGVEYSYMYVI